MSTDLRDLLQDVLTRYGMDSVPTPARLEGVLKDLGGEDREGMAALAGCLKVGVAQQLRSFRNDGSPAELATYVLQVERECSLPHDLATWAVECWAHALQPAAIANGTSAQNGAEKGEPARAIGNLSAPTPEAPPGRRLEGPTAPKAASSPKDFLARAPEPRPPPAGWIKLDEAIFVHPEESTERPSLAEALRDSPAGALLILKPGVHRHDVITQGNVHLQGEGDPAHVILEPFESQAIRVEDGASVHLHGLTIRALRRGQTASTDPLVEVLDGHLTLEDCDLFGSSGDIVMARGPAAELLVRRCHLHHAGGNGLIFEHGATGYVDDCQLYRNGQANLMIGPGSSPTIFGCRLSYATGPAIEIVSGGGLIENCDIWMNTGPAVLVQGEGGLRLRHCRVSAQEAAGVEIAHDAGGLFEYCFIFENRVAGVVLRQASQAHFVSCRVSENHGEGILAAAQAGGEFSECEIFGNLRANVCLLEEAHPTFTRCIIHDGQAEGLRLIDGATGRFEHCEISSNARAGVLVLAGSNPVLETCFLRNGLAGGIEICGKSEGIFRGCEISEHAGTAVLVTENSAPRFENCLVVRNGELAVEIDSGAQPIFENCAINHNNGMGLRSVRGAVPRMTDGEICGNAGSGIVLAAGGGGHWEEVHLIGNLLDGVTVLDGGQPEILRCRIERSGGRGLVCSAGSRGLYVETEIVASTGPGVEIEPGGNPTLREVVIADGKSAGFLVHAGASGVAERCQARGNEGGDWQIAAGSILQRLG